VEVMENQRAKSHKKLKIWSPARVIGMNFEILKIHRFKYGGASEAEDTGKSEYQNYCYDFPSLSV
jgi:hypothetical protein